MAQKTFWRPLLLLVSSLGCSKCYDVARRNFNFRQTCHRRGKWITRIPLAAVVLVIVWNYTEPNTIAYEINPMTLEVRGVSFVDRPVTGRTDPKIKWKKKMVIGEWLIDKGYLDRRNQGYWVLVKSYNPRWGFRKGAGVALQRVFAQAGTLTPMQYPSPADDNSELKEWCTENPSRAGVLWHYYRELARQPENLWTLRYVFIFAIQTRCETKSDFEFESLLLSVLNEGKSPDRRWTLKPYVVK